LGIVHSPIRGVHPNLAKGIKTFVKYFGGKDAKKAASIFSRLGIKTKVFKEAKTTEALKLWDTTQYGRLIMLEKEIHEWCKENKVDFKAVYTEANKDYNEGYTKLGRPEVVRPYLKHVEGPIGGHCVTPNAKLLGKSL
jgi:UDP-N-acetyl-D-mannosaminuronate dehydrogenase